MNFSCALNVVQLPFYACLQGHFFILQRFNEKLESCAQLLLTQKDFLFCFYFHSLACISFYSVLLDVVVFFIWCANVHKSKRKTQELILYVHFLSTFLLHNLIHIYRCISIN